MAFYSYHPYYSGSDYGEYNFNSYAVNYDYAQVPTFMAYNGYGDYNKPYYGYDPNPSLYFSPNYPSHSYQAISYSATTYTDPKSFEFDPNYGMTTQLVISYSKVEEEFNEPAFDEYDPTPYGGGYDIAETYGKPLPPSDEICYPPIKPSSSIITPPSGAVPPGSIVPLPLPTVEEKEGIDEKPIIPQNENEAQVPQEKPESQDSTIGPKREDEEEDNNSDAPDLDEPNEDEESEESQQEDDYYSGSGYGNGYRGEQYHEHEKQVPSQYPSGYGLEAMDLCESLFGYWPCLSRMKRREQQQHCCEEFSGRGNYCQENMWKGTADYLFGNPNPYGGGRGEDHGGELVYGYERHYPTQSQYRQIEYTDGSW